ncbi:MAG: hypothetical protein KC635_11870 [Myxococcales bacterium]|nr:hypothetical protein [Myxococcales bacterium]MCB9736696.1 hypothetical protein [Deltaproteobacteria bacterium]
MQRSPRRMATVAVLSLLFFLAPAMSGCFNTYELTQEEFAKLQGSDEIPLAVDSKGGEKLLVDRDTPIYVRSVGGRRYPLTPFNFKMTSSQLVASDRDTLLAISDLEDYEVDLFSDTQTILLISAGVAVVAGLIVITAVTAGSKSFDQ